MQYLGSIVNNKDLVTKEYVDNAVKVTGVKGNSETDYRTGNVNITATNIGLGNVGNFKAVSTVASQGLSTTEKSNARTNIGAQAALTNPVTGTGTSGYLVKFNGTSTITSGPQLGSSTTTFLRNDGAWATPSGGSTPTATQKTGSKSVATGSNVNLTSISVTSVPCLLFIGVEFPVSGTPSGRRRIWVSTTSAGATEYAKSLDANQVVANGSGTATKMSISGVIRTTGTYYLNAWQNQGSAITTAWEYETVTF